MGNGVIGRLECCSILITQRLSSYCRGREGQSARRNLQNAVVSIKRIRLKEEHEEKKECCSTIYCKLSS